MPISKVQERCRERCRKSYLTAYQKSIINPFLCFGLGPTFLSSPTTHSLTHAGRHAGTQAGHNGSLLKLVTLSIALSPPATATICEGLDNPCIHTYTPLGGRLGLLVHGPCRWISRAPKHISPPLEQTRPLGRDPGRISACLASCTRVAQSHRERGYGAYYVYLAVG